MEDYYNVRRLALVLAVQAEIEGMKAENRQHAQDERYNEMHFYEKAEQLRILASLHDQQL